MQVAHARYVPLFASLLHLTTMLVHILRVLSRVCSGCSTARQRRNDEPSIDSFYGGYKQARAKCWDKVAPERSCGPKYLAEGSSTVSCIC